MARPARAAAFVQFAEVLRCLYAAAGARRCARARRDGGGALKTRAAGRPARPDLTQRASGAIDRRPHG